MGVFKDFFDKLFGPLSEAANAGAIGMIESTKSVESVDHCWNVVLRQSRKDDPEVQAAYTAHRAALAAAGLIDSEHPKTILGWLGSEVANAVWAITEKALPRLLTWIDEFKEGYDDRQDHLDAMNAAYESGTLGVNSVIGGDTQKALEGIASSGEFGLNAAMNFVLRTTLYPSVYAFGRPFWEDWRQNAWASHPSMVPNMGDLVRMELREVFRPEFRKELIEDEPISKDFEQYAARNGYSKTHAENFWGAHWDLPSRSQGYEMYHRLRPALQLDKDGHVVHSGIYKLPATYSNPFDLDDLKTLLKRQDVLKRYRDQLVEIAYKPFTRVDVRRMYRAGVLSFEEVIAAYLDAGYSPERALKMAEFTKAWVTEGVEKRETKSGVLDAMKTGIISEAEAETELGAFYPADVAERYVNIAKIKNKLAKSDVAWLLRHGDMDESEARARFAEMGYPQEDIDYLIIRYAPE